MNPKQFHNHAFNYPLKRGNYDFKKATIEKFADPNNPIGNSEFHDYVPNMTTKSSIVSYEEFAKIW